MAPRGRDDILPPGPGIHRSQNRDGILQQVKWSPGCGGPSWPPSPAVPQTHLKQDSPNAPRDAPTDVPSPTSTLTVKTTHGEKTVTGP